MFTWWLRVDYVDGVYWTLTIELAFYVVMGVLFWTRGLKHFERIAPVWLILVLANYWLPAHWNIHVPDKLTIGLVLDYANLFIAGILFYKTMTEGHSAWRTALILGCLITEAIVRGGESCGVTAAFFCLFYLLIAQRLAFINIKPIIFLGTISYSLYLVHENIGLILIRAVDRTGLPPWLNILFATAASIALAALITYAVEKPALAAIRSRYRQYRERKRPSP